MASFFSHQNFTNYRISITTPPLSALLFIVLKDFAEHLLIVLDESLSHRAKLLLSSPTLWIIAGLIIGSD
jgi:hypothetical protein